MSASGRPAFRRHPLQAAAWSAGLALSLAAGSGLGQARPLSPTEELLGGLSPSAIGTNRVSTGSGHASPADELLAATRPVESSRQVALDASGLAPIDPLNRSREVRLSNRYLAMSDTSFRDVYAAELRQPFGDNGLLRLVVPFVASDQLELDTTTSSGDLRIGLDLVTRRRARSGLLLGADLVLDTSSEPQGGRGTHRIEPRIAWVLYRGERTVIAPSYRHTLGLAGEEWRPEINEGALGVQFGWMSESGKYWLALVPEVLANLEAEVQFFSGSLELGCLTGPNSWLYVRPAAGFSSDDFGEIGSDYPYDFSVEVGWRLALQ